MKTTWRQTSRQKWSTARATGSSSARYAHGSPPPPPGSPDSPPRLRPQAIETFAVTVKEIAQVLQGFGAELSDTELPDEASAIEFLLHSHTHRYRQMKVGPAPLGSRPPLEPSPPNSGAPWRRLRTTSVRC